LTIVVGVITLAITVGWLVRQAMAGLEVLLTDAPMGDTFAGDLPLFPFTIIGGAAVQLFVHARGWDHLVPRSLVNQTAGLALDLLITAAIASVSLAVIGDNLVPFLLMVVVGMAWCVAAVYWLAPRFYGPHWFERAIGDFGQSYGTVASGFLLIDMSDPKRVSGARESFGYKQLLFQLLFGGGVVTALAIPVIVALGAELSFVLAVVLTLLCAGTGLLMGRRAR
jgi:ESS family glutamate:Na+ symporter